MFGPIMVVWFLGLGAMGAVAIAKEPTIIGALDPRHAMALLSSHSHLALAIMGGAFLAVTGAEALYADMGHFGRTPVRIAWWSLVWPSLMLNYFGQGAYLLHTNRIEVHRMRAALTRVDTPVLQLLARIKPLIALVER